MGHSSTGHFPEVWGTNRAFSATGEKNEAGRGSEVTVADSTRRYEESGGSDVIGNVDSGSSDQQESVYKQRRLRVHWIVRRVRVSYVNS